MLSLSFIVAFLLSPPTQAVSLYVWNTPETLAPLIIAVRDGESPQAAARRYMDSAHQNPDLQALFKGEKLALSTADLRPLTGDRETRALLMANLPKDYTRDSLRVENFQKLFAESHHKSYILPIYAEIGLSEAEVTKFNDLIAEKFPLLVAMGGDDVDPRLYRENNTFSRNIIPARDTAEMSRIQSYVQKAKGFLLGICRGSQISSVALGYKMHQDVPTSIREHIPHANDWHDIHLKKTTHNILGSLSRDGKLYVNSLHHQAVIFQEGGPLEIAAISPDGVTEATEFKNGKGLLLQFHPELMDNELGSRILKKAVQQKIKVVPRSCSKLFL